MKNDRLIDLGLTGYEELFMSTEERLDAKSQRWRQSRWLPSHPFEITPLR